ncbi:hypothetical protein ACFU76_23070 [Streptomyces sp. NPDC057539]|uniref:hypothetical protein n=1 Tax=Streptomyces sp. NPDC057539 TaxID=3346159 RepID=UPI00367809BB
MPDDVPTNPADPHRSTPSAEPPTTGSAASNSWFPTWRRSSADRMELTDGESTALAAEPASPSLAEQHQGMRVRETGDVPVHLYGDVDIVAGTVEELNLEIRKRDVLEGVPVDRRALLQQPFVLSDHWTAQRELAVDPYSGRLREPVLIVVAPRSIGSTTFALRLLAECTAGHTELVKLDADWSAPRRGRLPVEKAHAFQLDLKDRVNDALSADFLDSLSKHAESLRSHHSYLVLTVARELWTGHHLSDRDGVRVVHLREAPEAQEVVEVHLDASGYSQLVGEIQSDPMAQASLRSLSAVAAVRAAHTIVMAWQEHLHLQQQPARADASAGGPMTLQKRIRSALTDWRTELDDLFGETTALHSSGNPSLTVDDRCLLLALAVWQSAPMPEVARSAGKLQETIGAFPAGSDTAALSPVQASFSSRGLRRRIKDVGADVSAQDAVVFDRPAYGRAVLEYVWDNYDVMREPLLTWLVETAQDSSLEDRAVSVLADLTVRHGTTEHLNTLGKIACSGYADVLSTVMESAVRNEHIGRLAWAVLYRWAEQREYAQVVIALCRRVLEDASVSTSAAKMAMVRLRRIAHTTGDPATRGLVLNAFEELARQQAGAVRLVWEVRDWQQDKASGRAGSLAFLALMAVGGSGMPWLMSAAPPGIDVSRAVQDLLSNAETALEIIPRLAGWIRTCAGDHDAYARLRDQLLPALRGHNMFQPCMTLMQELRGISTAEGVSAADDFYDHLVDPRVQSVFPLKGDAA